jgi:hypothetical protein
MKNLRPLLELYSSMTKQGKAITWFAGLLIAIYLIDWLFG